MATPDQLRVIDWIAETNFAPATLEAAGICRLIQEGESDRFVVVWPDGSYQTARLGELHQPPWKRGLA